MDYDPSVEIKAINDSKAGIKGLVDSGIVEIPRFFIRPPHELAEELNMCKSTDPKIPVVDLSGMEVEDQRKKIVDEIREASETWGFFQLINHGVPSSVLEGMVDGARKFHEQDVELKKEYYSTDVSRQVRYDSNLHGNEAKERNVNWKDTLFINEIDSGHIEPEEIPPVCRKASLEYMNHLRELADVVLGLLSEALGLKPDHLKALGCDKGGVLTCNYYPVCPQPELILGLGKHTDPVFFTILLQDQNGGLQVVRDNQCADVKPIEHGLVVNIGDLLQIVSNDMFLSAIHRVQANKVKPRISVVCFFRGQLEPPKIFGPIKELISDEKPALYKEFVVADYLAKYFSRPLDKTGLDLFRL